jgi:hypothetical protein
MDGSSFLQRGRGRIATIYRYRADNLFLADIVLPNNDNIPFGKIMRFTFQRNLDKYSA